MSVVALDPPRRPWQRDDERALVRAAQRGSADAVEALVRRNWERAHRTAFLIVRDAAAAEDVCQESMLAAVRAIGDFDRRRPFQPWLHRIVVNRSLDLLRERGRRAEVATEGAEAAAQRLDHRLPDDLARALAALDCETRAIVVLRHLLDTDLEGREHELPVDFTRVDGELLERAGGEEPFGVFTAFMSARQAHDDRLSSRYLDMSLIGP